MFYADFLLSYLLTLKLIGMTECKKHRGNKLLTVYKAQKVYNFK